MADTHTPVNEEVEVNLTLKVKITKAHYYGKRTAEELAEEIAEAKKNMKARILEMVEDEYFHQEELCPGKKGYVNLDYEVEAVDRPVLPDNLPPSELIALKEYYDKIWMRELGGCKSQAQVDAEKISNDIEKRLAGMATSLN